MEKKVLRFIGVGSIILGFYNIAPLFFVMVGMGVAGSNRFGYFCFYSLPFNFFFVAAGIGILLQQNWARVSLLILSSYNLFFSLVFWGDVAMRSQPMTTWYWIDKFLYDFMLAPIIPHILFLFFLTRPKVKEQFK